MLMEVVVFSSFLGMQRQRTLTARKFTDCEQARRSVDFGPVLSHVFAVI
jgi:hypothetical protein